MENIFTNFGTANLIAATLILSLIAFAVVKAVLPSKRQH